MSKYVELNVGELAPDFTLKNAKEQEVKLSNFKGRRVILYFYPKDDTPGCTLEARDFTKLKDLFTENNTVIFGISNDDSKSHNNFICKYDLIIDLLTDIDGNVARKYGAISEDSLLNNVISAITGNEYKIKRCSFLIDEQGTIIKLWPKVTAKDHAEEVLDYIKAL